MSSIEATEKESAAVAKGPRVSLEFLKGKIKHKYFVNAYAAIEENLCSPQAKPAEELRMLTLCFLVMENGFVVVGKTASASPENLNVELGQKFSYEDAIRQLWPLEGYALRETLAKK